MEGTTAGFSTRRRLTQFLLGASTAGAVLPFVAAPSASAAPEPPAPVAAVLADALTARTDATRPGVEVVDPGLWQTVANIAAAGVREARVDGSFDDTVTALQSLAGCAARWNAQNPGEGNELPSVCADPLAGLGLSIAPRLLAALALEDASPAEPRPSEHYRSPHSAPTGEAGPRPDTADTPDDGAAEEPDPAGTSELDTAAEEPDAPTDGNFEHGTEFDGSTPKAPTTQQSPPQQPPSWKRPEMAPFVAPTAGAITSTFGDGRGHGGIDIANTMGAPIVAVADGEVISAGPAQGFGLWVRIRHDDGTVTTYGHNNTNLVTVGQRVRAGQKIATVGNRGVSTGPHLHFEVEGPDGTRTDPLPWLAARRAAIVSAA